MTVTTETIATALGVAVPEPDSVTEKQWNMWITDARMLIDVRIAELSATPPDEVKIDYVVREAVVAQVRRPDDATQVTIQVDDGSTSKTYRSSAGRVTIRDEWWVLLGLTQPSGAFSIDTAPSGSGHLLWCSYYFGATYCSCGYDLAGSPIYEGAP